MLSACAVFTCSVTYIACAEADEKIPTHTHTLTKVQHLPEWTQCSQKSQDSQDAQDPVSARVGQRDQNVDQGHKHQQTIQDVPAGLEVALLPEAEAESYNLVLKNKTLSQTGNHDGINKTLHHQ